MPVLGVGPGRILCDLPVYDFQGYPLGDLHGACDGCRFDPATSMKNSISVGVPVSGSTLMRIVKPL